MKKLQIGPISFSEEGYNAFIEKSKKEQTEIVYNSLSPKDYERAAQLLKNIPHGNIGSGNAEADSKDFAINAGSGSNETGTKGRNTSSKARQD